MPEVILETKKRYVGWESVRISKSLETIAGDFDLSLADWWVSGDTPVVPGDPCRVLIDEIPVISGFVDEVVISDSPRLRQISIRGRDSTGDLVDCSAIGSGEWSNRTLEEISRDILAPYGLRVSCSVQTEPFTRFSIEDGETVFAALDRAARLRGILVVPDGAGIRLERAATNPSDILLKMGENVLEATVTHSQRDQFSEYVCRGRCPVEGWGDTIAPPISVSVMDTDVRRHRPLVIPTEMDSDTGTLERRAQWERNVRRGRARTILATVQGWQIKTYGRLWSVNECVRYVDQRRDLDTTLLISSVTFSLDKRGSRTELRLVPPEALQVEPAPKSYFEVS